MLAKTVLKNKNFLPGLVYLSFFIVYFLEGLLLLDPDFGWHLRFGQIILAKGIIYKDLFSYTMPSYNFIDHEWLSDLFFGFAYPLIGKFGLSVFFAFIISLSLFIQARIVTNRWVFIPLLLSGMSLFSVAGVRPQLFSILFFSIIISLVLNKTNYEKYKYAIPLLFLAWANLHGGFLFGMFILLLFFFSKSIKSQRIIVEDCFIFAFSIIATFINPYGLNLWKEILLSATDVSLRFKIQEWMPSFLFLNYAFVALSVLSVIIFIKYFKKFNHLERILFIILFFFGISSYRNISFFIPIATVVIVKGFNFFYKDLFAYPFGRERLIIVGKITTISCFLLFILTVFSMTFSAYLHPKLIYYPQNASIFLNANSSKGQIFSTYNWGGYLIWKIPDKKVFVDGRMPSWKNKNAPKSESKEAFLEWGEVTSGKIPLENEIKKYNIDTILLPNNFSSANKYSNIIDNLAFKALGIKSYDGTILENQIKELGFVIIYKDSIAVAYRKF